MIRRLIFQLCIRRLRLLNSDNVTALRLVLGLSACVALVQPLRAEPKTFRNEGLRNGILVRLDVQGKKVSGTFASDEYGDTSVPHVFIGEVIATPKGKRGVHMRIRFEGNIPYSVPPEVKELLWYLKIVDHKAHLFIPMQERSYAGKTPKWVVSDVEFLPD